jgi:hypothetical protein
VTQDDNLYIPLTNPSLVAATIDHMMECRKECPDRLEQPELLRSPGPESIVVDERALLRPAQVVEAKLIRIIREASLPVSHLRMRGLLRVR